MNMVISLKNKTIKYKLLFSSISMIVITAVILTVVNFFTFDGGLKILADYMTYEKLKGDYNSFHDYVDMEFGELSLGEDGLITEDGELISGYNSFVAEFADKHDVQATIFQKDGNDFRRIVTSLTSETGTTIVGTKMGSDYPAYETLITGNVYNGNMEVFGKPYATSYDPLIKNGEVIGALFVGVPLEEVNNIIYEAEMHSFRSSAISLVFVFALGVGLAIFFAAALSRQIRDIVDRVSLGATQIDESSTVLSNASQSLASSATQQAASLQETTSSLEEMSSQIKHNAANAGEAETAIDSARPLLEKGLEAMFRMNEAMEEIKQASQETSKIIKTIDDIAFQTNLLALNAAVEAARAGEAGKGFAVVAEEVRNLAQRSAEAAKNTSELIQHSQTSSDKGASVAGEVAESLESIEQSVNNVGDLVVEISTASKEQATGIEQLNVVMNQMDGVVQGNASSSEESASVAEELSSQASGMMDIVKEMSRLIDSKGDLDEVVHQPVAPENHHWKASPSYTTVKPSSDSSSQASELIPLDDFDEF